MASEQFFSEMTKRDALIKLSLFSLMNVSGRYVSAGVPVKKVLNLSQSGTRQLFDDPCLCFSSIPCSAARKIYLVQLSSIIHQRLLLFSVWREIKNVNVFFVHNIYLTHAPVKLFVK